MRIETEVIADSRYSPADSILDELTSYSYWFDLSDEEILVEAEQVRKGQFSYQGESVTFQTTFSPHDLDRGTPSAKLALASLYPIEILLDAYRLTEQPEYFKMARDYFLAFAEFEQRSLLPVGYLRNDHATATRVGVLIKFWRIYRCRDDYREAVARKIFRMAARTSQYLIKPSHFMYASNHGVIQNLALLQLALAFPRLSETDQFVSISAERLQDQFQFYINDEGVILEHSAGYQVLGLHLMAQIFRFLTLIESPIPDRWQVKYEKGLEFYTSLRRPDGTLPLIGDTETEINPRYPVIVDRIPGNGYARFHPRQDWPPPREFVLKPVAGYALWWDGLKYWPQPDSLTQTAVTWSYFRGQAHKLSDEMSIHVWAGGRDWISGAGYWPYGAAGRQMAESWQGANAPHLAHENIPDPVTGSYFTPRKTSLLFYGDSANCRLLDLQRDGPGSLKMRREIVNFGQDNWLMLDFADARQIDTLNTVWTFDHELTLDTTSGNYFLITSPGDKYSRQMVAHFSTANTNSISIYRGSTKPYLGWQAFGFGATPAPTLAVRQPAAKAWTCAFFSWQARDLTHHAPSLPDIRNLGSSQDWSIYLAEDELIRQHDTLTMTGRNPRQVLLTSGDSNVDSIRTVIASAYQKAGDKYPYFRSAIGVRWKITRFLALVFVIQEVFFFVYRRMSRRLYLMLRWTNCLCWVGGGIWLLTIYRLY